MSFEYTAIFSEESKLSDIVYQLQLQNPYYTILDLQINTESLSCKILINELDKQRIWGEDAILIINGSSVYLIIHVGPRQKLLKFVESIFENEGIIITFKEE
ncbi:hypothetical protein QNI16_34440 [Cytophagaceae bacterium YF14B1]|uniref:Uncharacterized protein n=1 Tax=Xanthocytophaga flava TaxID=3048013 RepID=A0AAE3UAK4_9BACT|nr:hypothetical protein [Xanthocytophaga flavus]MDJ1485641.1 hypothetical protein [Xanthocytophaga flavus]